MNAYYLEPGLALNERERARISHAITEVERAVHLVDAPDGMRVFDAYVTTSPTHGQYAGNAYVLQQRTSRRIKPRARKQQRRWWQVFRGR